MQQPRQLQRGVAAASSGATTHARRAVAARVVRPRPHCAATARGLHLQQQHHHHHLHGWPQQQQQQQQQQRRRLHTTTAAASTATTASGSSSTSSSGQEQQQQQQVVDYFAVDKRPVILYDGVCNMCNRGVNRVLDFDPEGVFRLAALQSGPGRALLARCGRSPDDLSSIVLVEEQGHYIKSEAVLRIASRLRMPLAALVPGLSSLLPRPLLDAAYDQLAANRYSVLGRSDSCRMTTKDFEDRFLSA